MKKQLLLSTLLCAATGLITATEPAAEAARETVQVATKTAETAKNSMMDKFRNKLPSRPQMPQVSRPSMPNMSSAMRFVKNPYFLAPGVLASAGIAYYYNTQQPTTSQK